MYAFFTGVFFIFVLLVMHLWPQGDQPWLVIFPDDQSRTANINAILASNSLILDMKTHNQFIIKPTGESIWQDLKGRGALLILNAQYDGGCGSISSPGTLTLKAQS